MNETVKIWLEDFLESKGVASLELCPREDVEKEIEEIKGSLSNERLWEKGYDGDESFNPHTESIMTLEEYLKLLEEHIADKFHYKWENPYPSLNVARVEVGNLEITCGTGRLYADGTYQYKIYLKVINSDSSEVITVTKVRGHLDDAKREAEKFLDKIKEDLCKN